MLFNSIEFLIFFPIVCLVYFLIPQKVRYIWLLLASYYFYMCWNVEYAFLMLLTTVVTWADGLFLEVCSKKNLDHRWKKACLISCLIVNLGILFFFKYYGFAIENVESLFAIFGVSIKIPVFDVLLPVGISFYTFQALAYVFDVYRGEIKTERNFLRYALFISFFPQLVAGPIERTKNMMHQIYEEHHFDINRVKDGLLLMGWGFFEKLVIADRIAILVTKVFDDFTNYTGFQIMIAVMLFAFQIYCDFGGYSDIAIGAARVMGFNLMKNFKSPYYATTVSGFWRNWHISLTNWFRDYIYIPLGGNRCGRVRKYANLLITFSVSGLWHGASWNYVVWGLLNGLYQVVGDITRPYRVKIQNVLKINTECWSYHVFQGIITFLFVDFAWLFFRANGFSYAIYMIIHSIQNFDLASMMDSATLMGINTLGMHEKDFYVMWIGIIVLMIVDYVKKKVDIKAALARQNLVFRWMVYYGIIFTILIFGIYGPEYDATAFIYFQF